MSDSTQAPAPNQAEEIEKRAEMAEDPTGRLAAYIERTESALDLLALLTLWIVIVQPGDFGSLSGWWYVVRIALSVVYGIDMAIRSSLARRHLHYLLHHPAGVAAVIFPPVRVIFSVRLIRSVFRRGNLSRVLVAGAILVLEGAAIVYLYERHATGSSIHTFGESIWWAVVTVTTVGYGDYTPVTVPGRITAAFIMSIGLLTLALVTAQVSSSFVSQGTQAPSGDAPPETPANGSSITEVTLDDLDLRLARIETLLTAGSSLTPPESGTAGPGATA